jgi:hypothetical protein
MVEQPGFVPPLIRSFLDTFSHEPLKTLDTGLFHTGLSFGFRVIGANPGFVTHNDIREKDVVISSTLSIISGAELATGRPECSSSSIEVLPALNREHH